MQDPDYNEDLYEEKSKLVYKRRSSTSQHDFYREPSSSRTDSDERSPEEPFRGHSYSSDRQRAGRRASWSEMTRMTEPIRHEMVQKRIPSFEGLEFSTDEPLDSEMDGRVEIRKVKKVWSYKTVHERSADQSSYGGRDDQSMKTSTMKTEDTGPKSNITAAEGHVYCPVAKWDVDYTNRNYVRSKCNKPIGLHRYTLGRQFKYDVDYDNSHYLRSKVNAPKGLHRRTEEIKRKRVPDKDVLGDSTGWEFEYGPEFLQVEEDVPYMPDERVVGRGAYRCYGVNRSNSDTDIKDEEKRQKIPGLVEDEFKYGPEFLQDDVQHTLKQKDGVIGRGAYRFYDADRSQCDKKPCDMMGIDYRESRTRTDIQPDENEDEDKGDSKGKPFKRTVLKKTLKLSQRPSDEKLFGDDRYRYGTHLKFVPGMGTRSTYEGTPTEEIGRKPDLHVTKHPSIRSVFKQTNKTCSYSKCGPSEEGYRCEKKYSHKHFWDRYPSGKNNGDYSVSKAIYPKEMKGQNFGSFDRCDVCERKETPEKMQKTPERSYEKERSKKGKRPPAQSYTSYESCNLCERKEVPGMGRKMSPGSGFTRGSAYSSKGYSEKEKRSPGRSYESFDSCDLCDKKELPRVATPEKIKELKRRKGSIRDTYEEKPSPAYRNNDRGYGKTEMYEKRRKTSPREYGASEGDKFHKWKEMEKRETRPLRMTGSITQRHPRNVRKEPRERDCYPRHLNQYAFPTEMMDDAEEDDEEMLSEMSPSIENRINEIKERISEKCTPREKGKVRQKNDDQDMSSEEFEPHVESTIKIVKKKLSRTSFTNGKRKVRIILNLRIG
ncbi:hypothetical protein HNY73_009101 [Argiope bruennichi]|uniref:Uncharacterized protein n=1 Tax=Argiope bruennichi TaxID=94029 RepID=A0A8T0F8H8_ARGBR|nr:hypothetical protein HNY73_009101 [Argiope bruennichi]